jgi:hypothetical protein
MDMSSTSTATNPPTLPIPDNSQPHQVIAVTDALALVDLVSPLSFYGLSISTVNAISNSSSS